jgi:hypothetical protein
MEETYVGIIGQCDKDKLVCRLNRFPKRSIHCEFPEKFLKLVVSSLAYGHKVKVTGERLLQSERLILTSIRKYDEALEALKNIKTTRSKKIKKAVDDLKESTKVTSEMLNRKATI